MRLILISAILLAGCNAKEAANPQPAPTEITSETAIAVAEPDATNSLNYIGLYKGVLPCADCEGIETTVELSEEFSYRRTWKYLGRNTPVSEENGKFRWNDRENEIILEHGKSAPVLYIVGEGFLKQLDGDGKEITGEIGKKFILRKLSENEAAKTDAGIEK